MGRTNLAREAAASAQDYYPKPHQGVEVPDTGYIISEQVFGALSHDSGNPLSRVSIANAAFSLDPFRGCPGRCSYCTAAGAARDITIVPSADGSKVLVLMPSQPELLFPGEELAEALMAHPAFLRDHSIIGIGTASTESFLPGVEEHTWQIIEAFSRHGYKNPFWIVIKLGVTDHIAALWAKRIELLRSRGSNLVISVTHAGAPAWVEPYQGDRFRNIALLKRSGARISLHMRPIIPGINDSMECAERVLDQALGIVEVVCVGGLRTDPGIKLVWGYVHGLDLTMLPPGGRKKILPQGYTERIRALVAAKGFQTPVVERSAEVLSYLLEIPEYNLNRYRPDDARCLLAIPSSLQQTLPQLAGQLLVAKIQEIAREIGLGYLSIVACGEDIVVKGGLSYEERCALIQAIGHAGILP